jgi:hypothetical protein
MHRTIPAQPARRPRQRAVAAVRDGCAFACCKAHRILHTVSPDNRPVSPSLVGASSEPQQLEAFLSAGG